MNLERRDSDDRDDLEEGLSKIERIDYPVR